MEAMKSHFPNTRILVTMTFWNWVDALSETDNLISTNRILRPSKLILMLESRELYPDLGDWQMFPSAAERQIARFKDGGGSIGFWHHGGAHWAIARSGSSSPTPTARSACGTTSRTTSRPSTTPATAMSSISSGIIASNPKRAVGGRTSRRRTRLWRGRIEPAESSCPAAELASVQTMARRTSEVWRLRLPW